MLPVYVMIGGRSRRFGKDKATVIVDGCPWAEHVGYRLAEPGAAFYVVGGAYGTIDTDFHWIPDDTSLIGPLAGVRAAIRDCLDLRGPSLLVIASCDLVRPQRDWLEPLVACHRENSSLEIAAYRTGELWQPFPCVVHTRWGESLDRRADANNNSLQSAFDAAASKSVGWVGEGGPPQANTPEELRRKLA